jgi:nucleotidyltransferase/DNA polymerase involved in DNA repair
MSSAPALSSAKPAPSPASDTRQLSDLHGIGRAMLRDFDLLGVRSVAQLARCDGDELYHRLSKIMNTRMDPCVHDVFVCAVEQARNPKLARDKCDWWYWSSIRKKSGIKL